VKSADETVRSAFRRGGYDSIALRHVLNALDPA
jgi:hypothetical protein